MCTIAKTDPASKPDPLRLSLAERAIKLVEEHSVSHRDAAKVCGIDRNALRRAMMYNITCLLTELSQNIAIGSIAFTAQHLGTNTTIAKTAAY